MYFTLMSNDLVNNIDGIWHPSNFIAGDWEISLGRGLQRYADRARFGLVTSAWNSIIVFLLIGISDCFIICKYRLNNTFFSFLFVFITIANPIVCESLTYSYMSVNFGLAFFFSVLSFFLMPKEDSILRERIRLLALSILMFAISMAFYQAYMCVYAVLSIFMLIVLAQENGLKNLKKTAVNILIVGLFGGLLYWAITKLLLLRAGIELASYKGANGVSALSIVINLPNGFVRAIKETTNYIYNNRMSTGGLEFSKLVTIFLLVVLCIIVVVSAIDTFKKNKISGILQLVLLSIVPVAASSVCLVAVGNGITGLMAMGILVAVLLFYLLAQNRKWTRIIMNVTLIVLAWYLVSSVQNDQIALKEGINATKTIAEKSVSDVYLNYSSDDFTTVAFVGRAAENPLFYKSLTYETANGYAQFGRWSTDARNNRVAWIGIMEMLCGTELPFCGVGEYEQIIRGDEIKDMPVYPQKGYIRVIDDILVIKISDLY